MLELKCENLEKKYVNKLIFRGVSFNLNEGKSLAVIGRNGSGKSTLLKIIANLIKSSSGKISLRINNKDITRENYFKYIGFCSPYLNLYDELTAFENLEFFIKLKSQGNFQKEKADSLLIKVNLYTYRNELVREYSTGMKQRLKLAFALINEPQILLLDEPQSNLDTEGLEIVSSIAKEQKSKGILILASNEIWDNDLCNITLNIEDYK